MEKGINFRVNPFFSIVSFKLFFSPQKAQSKTKAWKISLSCLCFINQLDAFVSFVVVKKITF
jgi:hypothetical protein